MCVTNSSIQVHRKGNSAFAALKMGFKEKKSIVEMAAGLCLIYI